MRFKSDAQRKAVFNRLNNRFTLKGDEFIRLMKEHSDALESAKKTAVIDPEKKITVNESPSLQRKDGNCFQRSREHGRFALRYDLNTKRITSDEYPTVNTLIISHEPKSIVGKLKGFPEQHLSGLGAIASGKYMGMSDDELGTYETIDVSSGLDADIPQFNYRSNIIRLRPDEEIKFYDVTHPGYMHNSPDDILAHELGHHVTSNVIGSKNFKRLERDKSELIADKYMHEQTGAKPWVVPSKGSEVTLDEAYAYLTALQEAKTPSIRDMIKQSKLKESDFSHDDRKRAGWYPRDSNLPDGFDDMVRTFTFEAAGKVPIFDPHSKADVSRVTADVCIELDKIWKPEWGKRPAGRYIRADVEDALEDL